MARIRRVETGTLRQVFERLNRSGELAILVAHLEDVADGLHEEIQSILSGEILVEPKQLAECQARQGALGCIRNLAVTYKQLGIRESAANEAREKNGGAAAPNAARRVSV